MDTQEFAEKYAQLTPKLHEVLTQVLQGIPDADIAKEMGIQPATVRKHIERIYRVFDLNSDFPQDRRSRRSDLFALFAQHQPEMLVTSSPTPPFPRGAGGDSDSNVTETTPTPPLPRGAGGDSADNVTETTLTPPFSKGGARHRDSADVTNNVTEPESKTHRPPRPNNPFIPLTGMVDDPDLFFNREKEIRDIFELLNSGSSVAVIGERGIGKSSVLQAICRQAESKLLQPREGVYLNLQPLENEDEFYLALCDRLGIPESRGYLLTRELEKKKRLLAMETLSGDGFTEGEMASHLRSLTEGMDPPVRLIYSSDESLDKLYQEKGKISPFKNICTEVNLGPWDETTARAFIDQRLAATEISFTEEEISQIIAETGGHPQQLMQRCHQVYAGYLEKNS